MRQIIDRQLYDAEPSQAARLAKEYRETREQIERIEGAGEDGGDDVIINTVSVLRDVLG